ncbi:MAG: LacI family transcriptional regulator [Lachnospiraceae bacterium]|nr:LacI family transcriptional regulator [Lachnospiraceae bacterium]
MKNVTIKDIAKICGVGVSTVSRAINDNPGINPATKERILKVIDENNYVPNNSARNLKRSESETIAVLVKGINNSFFSPMITEFEKIIQEKKYTFVLQRVDQNQNEIDVAMEIEKEKRLKGVVFLGGYFSHSKEKLCKLTVPFVLSTIGMTDLGAKKEFASVAVDDEGESFKIVDYLCSLGHKKIAILAAPEYDESIGKLRMEGYKAALKKNGIEFDNNLVFELIDGNDRYSIKSGYITTKKMLKSKAECTAIFAITDAVAIGACRAIWEEGMKVPENFSLAGFDGLELTRYYIPSLTTIRQPVEEIAKETLRMLFGMIENKEKINENVVFPGKLIIGESTRGI